MMKSCEYRFRYFKKKILRKLRKLLHDEDEIIKISEINAINYGSSQWVRKGFYLNLNWDGNSEKVARWKYGLWGDVYSWHLRDINFVAFWSTSTMKKILWSKINCWTTLTLNFWEWRIWNRKTMKEFELNFSYQIWLLNKIESKSF